MKLRIYADTSVLGGCDDVEFAEHSLRLLDSLVRGERLLVLSSLTVQELAAAPPKVRSRLATVPEELVELLQLDGEARELAETTSQRVFSNPGCGPTHNTLPSQP